MTQALLNNLNILQEKTVNMAEKMPKTEGMDFGKIFENKKSKYDTEKTYNDQTSNVSNPITKDTKQIKNENNKQEVSNYEKTAITNKNSNKTEKSDTKNADIQNKSQYSDNDENSAIDTKEISEEISVDKVENIIEKEEEENVLAELIADETTIMEEEPTMYNELNTLDDPTAVIILQSQIQKTVKNVLESEDTEKADNFISFKTSSQNADAETSSNSTAIFKQFDNIAKDINPANLTQKDVIQQKQECSKTANAINEKIVKELNVQVLEAQSAESEGAMGDLMQNQSPQEQTTRIMIQGDIKYEAVASQAEKAAAQVKTTDLTPSKIIEQISKQLDGMINKSKLNMVLNPGTLGKVNLQLLNSKEGLTAQFTVTTQEARDLLMKGLSGLKESLLAHGINIENVSVKIEESDSEYQPDYTEQENSQHQAKHQDSKKQKQNNKDFEQMMFELENEQNV